MSARLFPDMAAAPTPRERAAARAAARSGQLTLIAPADETAPACPVCGGAHDSCPYGEAVTLL